MVTKLYISSGQVSNLTRLKQKHLLYLRYFQSKLRDIRERILLTDVSLELAALMTDYSDKTSEFSYRGDHLWNSLLNGFMDNYALAPEKPTQWPFVRQKLLLSQTPEHSHASSQHSPKA